MAHDLPIACTLPTSEQVSRGEDLQELFKAVQQVNDLTDGYALKFPGSDIWSNKLLQFIIFERKCCSFFTFSLTFEPEQGPIWLHLRGPEGTRELIKDMLHTRP